MAGEMEGLSSEISAWRGRRKWLVMVLDGDTVMPSNSGISSYEGFEAATALYNTLQKNSMGR